MKGNGRLEAESKSGEPSWKNVKEILTLLLLLLSLCFETKHVCETVYYRVLFYFLILVTYEMQSRQLAVTIQRHMHHHKWFDNISSYHSLLLVIVQVLIPSAMIQLQMYTPQFWNSWFQRERIITCLECSIIMDLGIQENILTFHYRNRCFKLICRITKIIAPDIITCCRQKTICWSHTLSRMNACVKRRMTSKTCRATGNEWNVRWLNHNFSSFL